MGSSRPPPPRTQDFFPAPALSLSLAGAFGRNEPVAPSGEEVEAGDEGDGGIRLRPPGEAAEISSENTGPGSQSGGAWSGGEEEAAGHGDGGDHKRRKRYHRHTAEQITAMEAVFKESPHPDEKQRQQLSQELGLSARQVKFWFQNRRTQIKATQERHENSLLKSELEKLQEENRAVRELVKKSSPCPSCGAAATAEEQQLRLENAQLKAEVAKLRGTLGNAAAGAIVASPPSPPCSAQAIQIKSRGAVGDSVDGGGGGLRLGHDEKTKILDLAGRALHELAAMCSSGEPLWVRSVETGRDVLNYDEYVHLFRPDDDSGDRRAAGWSVEASRETGVVYLDTMQLVHAFMDPNQWKELFPTVVSKAATLGVIRAGSNDDQDGVVQLMLAEVQTLTPLVPTREFHFIRYCKKLTADKWAIVDVSHDDIDPDAQTSSTASKCLKKPSGCVIEEQSNGRCKVTWVEHATCRAAAAPSMYRAAAASGLAFGARRWVAALQLQCERMVFSVATNIPARDSNGVATPAGRRSVLKLAHRMTSSLCRVIGGSRDPAWSTQASSRGGVRVASRWNAGGGDPGEPRGLIACAVLSAWLPVGPASLFDFLRDGSRRHEWDVMLLPGRQPVQSCLSVAKGKDRRNCVTAYAVKPSTGEQGDEWILQDSSTNPCEATVAYAPVDAAALRPVIDGHDSSGVVLLPCGFAVVPDGLEPRPAVITSRKEEEEDSKATAEASGSLVTVAFQALAGSALAADGVLPPDAAETVAGLASCALGNIKKALRCEDC
ncbi:unnamed protein product [Urochloa humidicola]